MRRIDETKTLEQLENSFWKDADFPTLLVEKCYQYRKVAVKDLSVEQIRLLVGQNIGLPFLIPKSLNILSENILAEGDFFPGDLLTSVLQVNEKHWKEYPIQKAKLIELLTSNVNRIEFANEDNIHKQLLLQINDFISKANY